MPQKSRHSSEGLLLLRGTVMNSKNRFSSFFLAALTVMTIAGCGNSGDSSSVTSTPSDTTEAADITTTSATTVTSLTSTAVTTTETPVTSTETTTQSTTDTASQEISETETVSEEQPTVVSEIRAGLYRADTMECLYGLMNNTPIYPASLTKILTACTALRYASPDTVYTVGSELSLVHPNSSLCLIQRGHRLTLHDLLRGMLMSSGNDAAYTVAVNVAREVFETDLTDEEAVSYFVELMNKYATELGAENSHFVTPDGWDNPEQLTTVHDLALISAEAMRYDVIREIAETPSKYVVFASGEIITWYNTNALLHPDSQYYLPQAIGLKTGTTDLAGKCVIAVLDISGTEYIAISANCRTNSERYETIQEMIEMT